MLHKFHLGESWKTNITVAERNALIRYCISIGTRAKCSTRAVMRPFKQKYLTAALRELRKNFMQKISEYTEWMRSYAEGETKLPDWLIDYFEGIPTKEIFTDYCRSVIKQERGTLRSLMKNYSICVDFAFTDKKWLAFHHSLNPRVTFGYSNRLHEVCDFALTEEVKNAFLNSSLKELPAWRQDWTHDWGYVYFDSITNLLYEDLAVMIGERYILETISHEEEMTVSLTDEELTAFIDFEGKRNENLATVENLTTIEKLATIEKPENEVREKMDCPMKSFAIRGVSGECIYLETTEAFGFPQEPSFRGGYDIKCNLEIISGLYHISTENYFTSTGALYNFYIELLNCYEKLNGKAHYKVDCAENDLQLDVVFHQGQVKIIGKYQDDRMKKNILNFEFDADQSYFKEVLSDLKKMISAFGDNQGIRN